MGTWGNGPRENDTALDTEGVLVEMLAKRMTDHPTTSLDYREHQAHETHYAAMLCMESKTLREAWCSTHDDNDDYEAFGNFVARMARRFEWAEGPTAWFDKALPVLEAAELGGTSLLTEERPIRLT
jgi:hypothetical protein